MQTLNAGSFVIDVGEDGRHGSEKHCPWDTQRMRFKREKLGLTIENAVDEGHV